MKMFSVLVILFAVAIISACKKDAATTVTPEKLQGNYTGWVVSDGIETVSIVGNVSVQISGGNYQSAFTSSSFPAGSSKGSFTVNNNQVVFVDSLAHTANFNWGVLLNGTYATQFKGDSLILNKSDGSYSYRLKKQ